MMAGAERKEYEKLAKASTTRKQTQLRRVERNRRLNSRRVDPPDTNG